MSADRNCTVNDVACNNEWSSKVLCRYFLHGVCREKENCRYSHNIKDKPSNICKFYNLGSCSYGDKCRYDHVKVNKPKLNEAPATHRIVKQAIKGSNWANATEFIPGKQWQSIETVSPSYASITDTNDEKLNKDENVETQETSQELCPYAKKGICLFIDCAFIHGDICELCGKNALHPLNMAARTKHTEDVFGNGEPKNNLKAPLSELALNAVLNQISLFLVNIGSKIRKIKID